jgi:hypothetical protein
MGKYLDPRADLTFKKVFGERRVGEQSSGMHKNLVISLLNALLPLKDDERVESIEYWPAEKVPDRLLAEKDSIVDVCCKDNKNREFIVEMQMTWTDYYHYYHLVHDKYTDKVIDGLHLIFVELKKFFAWQSGKAERKPQSFSEKKMQVLWLRFLTEINDETREVPAELLENPEVSEALEIVERAAFDDGEMRAYDKFWDAISRQKTIKNDIKREAEKAIAEANAKLFDTARKMKADGMTMELIAKYTGLAAEEIDSPSAAAFHASV